LFGALVLCSITTFNVDRITGSTSRSTPEELFYLLVAHVVVFVFSRELAQPLGLLMVRRQGSLDCLFRGGPGRHRHWPQMAAQVHMSKKK